MSRQPQPPFVRKTSAPWDRLRPVKQDPLESVGYVSKGDNRLLDLKTQETFYQKIVDRYMQFCTRYKRDLHNAHSSFSQGSGDSQSFLFIDGTTRSHMNTKQSKSATTATSSGLSVSKWASSNPSEPTPPTPADELSTILMALRKLREGLLATSSKAGSVAFSQRVHVFNIRVAVLAMDSASYHHLLPYLLDVLHTHDHPLETSELNEMTTYLILDLALRQDDSIAAYERRHRSRQDFNYQSRMVDTILQAVMAANWVAFWRAWKQVDGYIRSMMHWHVETIRKSTLKSFGRAYLKVDLRWLLKSVSGGEMSWDELITKEAVGWSLDGETVVIRKPKPKS